jgi:hypothetical protein
VTRVRVRVAGGGCLAAAVLARAGVASGARASWLGARDGREDADGERERADSTKVSARELLA